MIDISPDYKRATELIDYLAGDTDLTPLVFPEVFSRMDQASAIGVRTLSYGGCIAVGLGNPANAWAGDRNLQVPRLYASLMVHVFVSALARPPEPHGDFFSFSAGLVGHCLGRVMRWQPYGEHSVNLPIVQDVVDLNLAQIPDMRDVVGKTINLAIPVNF